MLEKCPVCEGRGIVPKGFYNFIGGNNVTNSSLGEQCRACGGKGYVNTFTQHNPIFLDKED